MKNVPRAERHKGIALVVLGGIVAAMIATVLWFIVPPMLQPGMSVGGTTFTGSRRQARLVMLILGAVALFGLAVVVDGAWLIATGRHSRWGASLGVAMLIYVMLMAVWLGFQED